MKRLLVETAMFHTKQIFSDKLKACNFEKQVVETRIKVTILNRIIVEQIVFINNIVQQRPVICKIKQLQNVELL